ncbi:MAG: prepilin peptidase [Elusimicrobia bacterium]|nr:prepilin peptidase [Elusimicrobiota bacterium]
MEIILIFIAVIIGLIIGSFLNVCIHRIPKGLSIIRPRRSLCPKCSNTLNFYDNIPVVSFIVLRGKCRNCKNPISARYPITELITAFITALMFFKWSSNPFWLIAVLLSSYIFIIIAIIDFETLMIADIFSYAIGFIGLSFSFFNPYFSGEPLQKLAQSAIGALVGAALIWLLAFIGKKIYKKEAVGEGDIFLMAAIGAMLGIEGIISSLIMASLFGSVYGITLMILKKAKRFDHIPFGPFLSLSAIINMYSLVKLNTFFFYI